MWNTLEREFSPWPWAKCTYFDFNSFKHIQKYQVYSWDYCILFWQGFHLVWDIKTIKSYFKILLINLFPKNMKIPILTSFDRTFKTIQPNVTPRPRKKYQVFLFRQGLQDRFSYYVNSVGLQTVSAEHLGQNISAYVVRSIRARTKCVHRNRKGLWEGAIRKN